MAGDRIPAVDVLPTVPTLLGIPPGSLPGQATFGCGGYPVRKDGGCWVWESWVPPPGSQTSCQAACGLGIVLAPRVVRRWFLEDLEKKGWSLRILDRKDTVFGRNSVYSK